MMDGRMRLQQLWRSNIATKTLRAYIKRLLFLYVVIKGFQAFLLKRL